MSLCIGLTGGIASGKSTVAEAFADLGVPYIDADNVARQVVQPGSPGLQQVVATFGKAILDDNGAMNRRMMREKVFSDTAQRKILESILHPLIRQGLRDWREQISAPYGLMVVPIMLEGGFVTLVDRLLVVDVTRETQIRRLIARDDVTQELALQMLAAQASREERLAAADDVLDNEAPISSLPSRVAELHQRYIALA